MATPNGVSTEEKLALAAARQELDQWRFARATLLVRLDVHREIHSAPEVLKEIEAELVKASLAVKYLESRLGEPPQEPRS